jgi:hypothetical protein
MGFPIVQPKRVSVATSIRIAPLWHIEKANQLELAIRVRNFILKYFR